MPTYEYRCLQCQVFFTSQASMHDPMPTRGPECSSDACDIKKCISRVFGQVIGATQAPPQAAVSQSSVQAPTHVCAKYCDQHR